MSEPNLTPHTAPRTLEALANEQPYKLRLLLTDLGGLQTEEQKMAWHHLANSEGRANHLLAVLKQWDAANPGAAVQAANGAPVPQQPAQPAPIPQQAGFIVPTFATPQPVQPVPAGIAAAPMGGPPMVSQQAAAQATAATQAEATKGRRQPRNGGIPAAGDADIGAQVITMLQTILTGLGVEAENRMGWQKQITEMLEEAASGKASRVTALEQKYDAITQMLHALVSAQQTQQQLQIWTLMAIATHIGEQTGAGIVQVLGTAIGDSAMFQKLVDQATGKA